MNKEVVIFTHIPKVAGTSLEQRLVRPNVPHEEIKRFAGIRDLLATERAAFGVLVGHSVYGVHHFIGRGTRYFTMLRDPVDRAISHYFFIKQPARDPKWQGNRAQLELHNRYPLSEIFLRTRSKRLRLTSTWLIDNLQTRYLSGYYNFWRSPSSTSMLSAAKANLRLRYDAFGIQERFEDSVARISDEFRWPDSGSSFSSKRTIIEKSYDDVDLDPVKRYNQLDRDLYDYATELFRKRGLP